MATKTYQYNDGYTYRWIANSADTSFTKITTTSDGICNTRPMIQATLDLSLNFHWNFSGTIKIVFWWRPASQQTSCSLEITKAYSNGTNTNNTYTPVGTTLTFNDFYTNGGIDVRPSYMTLTMNGTFTVSNPDGSNVHTENISFSFNTDGTPYQGPYTISAIGSYSYEIFKRNYTLTTYGSSSYLYSRLYNNTGTTVSGFTLKITPLSETLKTTSQQYKQFPEDIKSQIINDLSINTTVTGYYYALTSLLYSGVRYKIELTKDGYEYYSNTTRTSRELYINVTSSLPNSIYMYASPNTYTGNTYTYYVLPTLRRHNTYINLNVTQTGIDMLTTSAANNIAPVPGISMTFNELKNTMSGGYAGSGILLKGAWFSLTGTTSYEEISHNGITLKITRNGTTNLKYPNIVKIETTTKLQTLSSSPVIALSYSNTIITSGEFSLHGAPKANEVFTLQGTGLTSDNYVAYPEGQDKTFFIVLDEVLTTDYQNKIATYDFAFRKLACIFHEFFKNGNPKTINDIPTLASHIKSYHINTGNTNQNLLWQYVDKEQAGTPKFTETVGTKMNLNNSGFIGLFDNQYLLSYFNNIMQRGNESNAPLHFYPSIYSQSGSIGIQVKMPYVLEDKYPSPSSTEKPQPYFKTIAKTSTTITPTVGILNKNKVTSLTGKGIEYRQTTATTISKITVAGTTTTDFTATISSLDLTNNTYKIRAYAANSIGSGYTEWINVKLYDVEPTIIINSWDMLSANIIVEYKTPIRGTLTMVIQDMSDSTKYCQIYNQTVNATNSSLINLNYNYIINNVAHAELFGCPYQLTVRLRTNESFVDDLMYNTLIAPEGDILIKSNNYKSGQLFTNSELGSDTFFADVFLTATYYQNSNITYIHTNRHEIENGAIVFKATKTKALTFTPINDKKITDISFGFPVLIKNLDIFKYQTIFDDGLFAKECNIGLYRWFITEHTDIRNGNITSDSDYWLTSFVGTFFGKVETVPFSRGYVYTPDIRMANWELLYKNPYTISNGIINNMP